ncbi:MAG: hypothetical protein H5T86_16710, partial [Armatimonadetes bacterium]|nr:hypothetical protein [Armatimonadota bacterium]
VVLAAVIAVAFMFSKRESQEVREIYAAVGAEETVTQQAAEQEPSDQDEK